MTKEKKPQFPRIASKILQMIARPEINFPIAADLEEEFHERVSLHGLKVAQSWFRYQVIKVFFPILFYKIYWNFALTCSSILITWRRIKREKVFSFINITGLALGISCFILILLWIRDEFGYDRYHHQADSLFRVMAHHEFSDPVISAATPAPLGPFLVNNYPEIDAYCRFLPSPRILFRYENRLFYEENGALADTSFLKMFGFKFVRGNPENALDNLQSIVITQSTAEKYFGSSDPLGKPIRIENILDVNVTGVIQNIPKNSHLQFDFLLPLTMVKLVGGALNIWEDNSIYTYIQINDKINYAEVESKISGIIKTKLADSVTTLRLQPVTRIHLYSSSYIGDIARHGDIRYIYIFLTVAVFILIMACVNFINLSTSRSYNRAEEMGMRKVIGAHRTDLQKQFLGESILMSGIATILAGLIVLGILPAFNRMSGKEIILNIFQWNSDLFWLIGIALFVGTISALYPALIMSAFDPARVLKGVYTKSKRGVLFRRSMVVFQFALSLFLVTSTFIIHQQLEFLNKKKLGFNKENIVYVSLGRNPERYYDSLKNKLLENPDVLGVTAATELHTNSISSRGDLSWPGKAEGDIILMYQLSVDYDYFKTCGMEIIEGREFLKEYPLDISSAFIVNEKAAKIISTESPIGLEFSVGQDKGKIIGIVNDFHFRSLNHVIEPLVIRMFRPATFSYLIIRINGYDFEKTLQTMESTWKQFAPNYPFSYQFLDQEFNYLYHKERRMAEIFDNFSLLAVIIACLGLFGLATYWIQQKTKEIGIRKVLGASGIEIVTFLSQEFFLWILIGCLFAWPIVFLIMSQWLKNFAYSIEFPFAVFFGSTLLVILVAALTVSYQVIKSARTDPVRSIRYE